MALSDLQSVVQFIFLGKGVGGGGEHHWILIHTKGRLGSFIFHSVRFLFSVNNAGVGSVGVLECMPMDQVKQLFEVNFFGALRLIQAVLPGMKARESGYIVNVSSMAGELGGPFNDIYCASKFALGGLTESLAPVLRQFKIK